MFFCSLHKYIKNVPPPCTWNSGALPSPESVIHLLRICSWSPPENWEFISSSELGSEFCRMLSSFDSKQLPPLCHFRRCQLTQLILIISFCSFFSSSLNVLLRIDAVDLRYVFLFLFFFFVIFLNQELTQLILIISFCSFFSSSLNVLLRIDAVDLRYVFLFLFFFFVIFLNQELTQLILVISCRALDYISLFLGWKI